MNVDQYQSFIEFDNNLRMSIYKKKYNCTTKKYVLDIHKITVRYSRKDRCTVVGFLSILNDASVQRDVIGMSTAWWGQVSYRYGPKASRTSLIGVDTNLAWFKRILVQNKLLLFSIIIGVSIQIDKLEVTGQFIYMDDVITCTHRAQKALTPRWAPTDCIVYAQIL